MQLPCVVQLGFSGARQLIDESVVDTETGDHLERDIKAMLAGQLKSLRGTLGLSERHFFCGISQMAVGADFAFSRSCRQLGIPHRVFLPQSRDEFLNGRSTSEPDFTTEESSEANDLLSSDHVIQERVVSTAADRNTRFEDASLEILRVSDVIVVLLREDAQAKPGGSVELLRQALRRDKPVLELRISYAEGKVQIESHPHNFGQFVPPDAPEVLAASEGERTDARSRHCPPAHDQFCQTLKDSGSRSAIRRQTVFRSAAAIIIITHIIATACGAMSGIANELHELAGSASEIVTPFGFGLFELLLLTAGFVVHFLVHHGRVAKMWAASRLVAELSRSVSAVRGIKLDLQYLFGLQLPTDFRPLLRTLNVLHLQDVKQSSSDRWESRREQYIRERMDDQITFYGDSAADSLRRHRYSERIFQVCSVSAIGVTAINVFRGSNPTEFTSDLAAVLAVVLPAIALGSLTLSASLDFEARSLSYTEVLDYLKQQRSHLTEAASENEFEQLVTETEAHLLAEVTGWYNRRSALEV